MIISTLNVNGIRSAETKGLLNWMSEIKADIICFQELKATKEQIPEKILESGYFGYFKPAEKKGYSGVGILTKQEPIRIIDTCGIEWIDFEGRFIAAEFETYIVVSVYFPSGTTGEERQTIKYTFLNQFFEFIHSFQKLNGKEIILCGDMNIAHKEIDIHNPISNKNSSGFLPEEREWFTKFLASGYDDVFRTINENKKSLYSWWSFRAGARKNNKGWRIDYQLCTQEIAKKAKKAWIDTNYILSDHASVTIEYEI
jgi:exodeoxyribonuclease III